MIYAVFKLNKGLKEIKELLPRNCLLLVHALLLLLLIVSSMAFYVFQYIMYIKCKGTYTSQFCYVCDNMLQLSNGLYTLIDAICFVLILYMIYKFLIPTKHVTIKPETHWLKS
jgi:hypothetical protein